MGPYNDEKSCSGNFRHVFFSSYLFLIYFFFRLFFCGLLYRFIDVVFCWGVLRNGPSYRERKTNFPLFLKRSREKKRSKELKSELPIELVFSFDGKGISVEFGGTDPPPHVNTDAKGILLCLSSVYPIKSLSYSEMN